ncbi:MAG: hypothetical protein ABIX01_18285 [Chitinophagaceae bacterium]
MKSVHLHTILSKAARLTVFGVALMVSVSLFAAKGDSKVKKGVVLKFSGFDLKATTNLRLFSKPGFLYKGSFSNIEKAPQSTFLNSIITFQRGNTTFIYPYQYKITVPKFKTPAPVQR